MKLSVLFLAATAVAAFVGGTSSTRASTFCEQAISPDHKGWTSNEYAAAANQRGLTFRDCDEMNHRPPTPIPKSEDDNIALGVALVLFYDENCEKLPRAFVYSNKAVAETLPTMTIMKATDRATEMYTKHPKLWCQTSKSTVEKIMAETSSLWHY